MKLKVITTQKIIEHEVDWVELNTPVGNMIIQQGHTPMIIQLSQGHELAYQISGGATESILIVQAVAHVTRFEVQVLIPMDV
jgi:F0F1-type ATP synthase epsilon subunit